jgi:hypothetical protein
MKKRTIFLTVFVIFLVFFVKTESVWAEDAYLFLSPTSGSYSASFNAEIKVNTGGKTVGGVDVYLEFPQDLLKIDSVTKGSTFPEVNSLILNEQGKLRLTAYFPLEEADKVYKGTNGLIATLVFSPLQTGSASVSFICSPGATNDSNIVEKETSQEIIVCTSNLHGSYQLTSAGPTATPTQKPTPTPTTTSLGTTTTTTTTPTPTPSIPVSGSIAETLSLVTIGLLTLLTGLALAF